MIEALGSEVVGLQLVVGDGPGRRYAAPVLDLAEVLAAQAEERGAVELGVAADEVVRVRMERPALRVQPDFLRVVAGLEIDLPRVPVLPLARHEAAALEHENALACRRERVEQRAPAGPRPDDDHVVRRCHGTSRVTRTAGRPRPWMWWRAVRQPSRRTGTGIYSQSRCHGGAWRNTLPRDRAA